MEFSLYPSHFLILHFSLLVFGALVPLLKNHLCLIDLFFCSCNGPGQHGYNILVWESHVWTFSCQFIVACCSFLSSKPFIAALLFRNFLFIQPLPVGTTRRTPIFHRPLSLRVVDLVHFLAIWTSMIPLQILGLLSASSALSLSLILKLNPACLTLFALDPLGACRAPRWYQYQYFPPMLLLFFLKSHPNSILWIILVSLSQAPCLDLLPTPLLISLSRLLLRYCLIWTTQCFLLSLVFNKIGTFTCVLIFERFDSRECFISPYYSGSYSTFTIRLITFIDMFCLLHAYQLWKPPLGSSKILTLLEAYR